jgi:hypothetical protein
MKMLSLKLGVRGAQWAFGTIRPQGTRIAVSMVSFLMLSREWANAASTCL